MFDIRYKQGLTTLPKKLSLRLQKHYVKHEKSEMVFLINSCLITNRVKDPIEKRK